MGRAAACARPARTGVSGRRARRPDRSRRRPHARAQPAQLGPLRGGRHAHLHVPLEDQELDRVLPGRRRPRRRDLRLLPSRAAAVVAADRVRRGAARQRGAPDLGRSRRPLCQHDAAHRNGEALPEHRRPLAEPAGRRCHVSRQGAPRRAEDAAWAGAGTAADRGEVRRRRRHRARRRSGRLFSRPLSLRSFVDATGAGDSFCGGALVGLARSGDPVDALLRGSVSASFAVAAVGPAALVDAPYEVAERRLASLCGRVEAHAF